MRNSSRGSPSRTKVSMFMHVCWRTELPTSNPMSFLSQMLVLQVRRIHYQRWSKMRRFCACLVQGIFGCWSPQRSACKGFFGISLSLLSPSCLKGVLASCTPAPVGRAMLLLAAACLKWFVNVLRAGSGKLFVFNELPWSPPSWAGTVDHSFIGRAQFPSHHFPTAKGFGDVVAHRFSLHSARSRRWALTK